MDPFRRWLEHFSFIFYQFYVFGSCDDTMLFFCWQWNRHSQIGRKIFYTKEKIYDRQAIVKKKTHTWYRMIYRKEWEGVFSYFLLNWFIYLEMHTIQLRNQLSVSLPKKEVHCIVAWTKHIKLIINKWKIFRPKSSISIWLSNTVCIMYYFYE